MSRFTLPAMLTAAALAVGCAGSVYSDGYGYYDADVYTPDLISIGTGVSVVAGYHDPVFYSDNYYWRPDTYGRWYRSNYYDRGFGYYGNPPYAVSSIYNPYGYRNYRPYGYYGGHYDHHGHGSYGPHGYGRQGYRNYQNYYRGHSGNQNYYRGHSGNQHYRGSSGNQHYRGSSGNQHNYGGQHGNSGHQHGGHRR